MKKLLFLPMLMIFSFLFSQTAMAEIPLNTPAWQKIKKMGKEGMYVFLFFGDTSSEAGKSMRALINDVEKQINEKGQDFGLSDVVEIKPLAGEEQELIKFFKLEESPSVVVFAPNEAVTGYFVKSVDKEALLSSIRTPKETEVVKGIQEGKAAFVCFYKEQDPELQSIKKSLVAVGSNFRGAVNIIYIGNNETKEDKLRESFKASSGETAVYVVLPPGAVVAKLSGADITRENLMKVLLASMKGGCCPVGSEKKCN